MTYNFFFFLNFSLLNLKVWLHTTKISNDYQPIVTCYVGFNRRDDSGDGEDTEKKKFKNQLSGKTAFTKRLRNNDCVYLQMV